uniref:Uncharacterized protein n=1 Tax=Cucumis melo TaxID=3656 RepID=A0A9I9DZ40_CUCME
MTEGRAVSVRNRFPDSGIEDRIPTFRVQEKISLGQAVNKISGEEEALEGRGRDRTGPC